MTDKTDKEILTELHQFMLIRKRVIRILSIALLLLQTSGFVVLTKELNTGSMNLVFFGGLVLIFSIVFSGRIALYLARRKFKERYREEDLLKYSDAEDLGADIDQVLKTMIRRRVEWT